jgi:hypothetical protein
MYVNHIERLKSKIREMEVTNLANEARPKASEDRLEHQQRTIHGNAVLLQTLQMQHTNAQCSGGSCSSTGCPCKATGFWHNTK